MFCGHRSTIDQPLSSTFVKVEPKSNSINNLDTKTYALEEVAKDSDSSNDRSPLEVIDLLLLSAGISWNLSAGFVEVLGERRVGESVCVGSSRSNGERSGLCDG